MLIYQDILIVQFLAKYVRACNIRNILKCDTTQYLLYLWLDYFYVCNSTNKLSDFYLIQSFMSSTQYLLYLQSDYFYLQEYLTNVFSSRLIVSHICQIFFLWNIISDRTHIPFHQDIIIMELFHSFLPFEKQSLGIFINAHYSAGLHFLSSLLQ